MNNFSLVFFGNSIYSKIGAEIINSAFSISSVVTTTDKPVGRRKELTESPVKAWAKSKNIKVLETDQLGEKEIQEIAKLKPDFLIVEDYGLILPNELLEVPRVVPLNIHHSLLPKYRGPSPAPQAILNGDQVSGVTIIKMTDEVDAGDILGQREYELKDEETTDSLLQRLNQLGGELMVQVLRDFQTITPIPQDNSKATLTLRMSKEDSYFDINNPPNPEKLDRMIRAYYPWPVVWTKWRGKIVKLLPLTNVVLANPAEPEHPESDPGLKRQDDDGAVLIQMEGKTPIPLKSFLNGYPDFPIKVI